MPHETSHQKLQCKSKKQCASTPLARSQSRQEKMKCFSRISAPVCWWSLRTCTDGQTSNKNAATKIASCEAYSILPISVQARTASARDRAASTCECTINWELFYPQQHDSYSDHAQSFRGMKRERDAFTCFSWSESSFILSMSSSSRQLQNNRVSVIINMSEKVAYFMRQLRSSPLAYPDGRKPWW
jgi:hypothetical protein